MFRLFLLEKPYCLLSLSLFLSLFFLCLSLYAVLSRILMFIFAELCTSLFKSKKSFKVQGKIAKRINFKTLMWKYHGLYNWRSARWNFEKEEGGSGIEFGLYMSHLEFNAIRWERKKIRRAGGKRKSVIGGSDGSEARGKRMGFNIASSTVPDGDSYNDGARGLAKPYRLWVRDSTE